MDSDSQGHIADPTPGGPRTIQEVLALCAASNVQANGVGMEGRWTVCRILRVLSPRTLTPLTMDTYTRLETFQRSAQKEIIFFKF